MKLLLEARAKITLDNPAERSAATGSYTDNSTEDSKKKSEISQVALLTQKVEEWNKSNGKVIDKYRNVVVNSLVDHGMNENSNPLYYLVLNASDALLKSITYNKASKFQSLIDEGDIKTKHVKKYLVDDETFWAEADNDVNYKLDILSIFFDSRELSKYKNEKGEPAELGDIMDGDNFMKADDMRKVCDTFFDDDSDVPLGDCLSELRLPKPDDDNAKKQFVAILASKSFITNPKYGITDKHEQQLLIDFVTSQITDTFKKQFLKKCLVPTPVSPKNCVAGLVNYYEKTAKGKSSNYTFQTVCVKNGLNDKITQLLWFTSLVAGLPKETDYTTKLNSIFNSSEYTEFLQSGKLQSTATKAVRTGLVKYLEGVDIITTTGNKNIVKENNYHNVSEVTDNDRKQRITAFISNALTGSGQTDAQSDLAAGAFDNRLKRLYSTKHNVSVDNPWKLIDNELRNMLLKYAK